MAETPAALDMALDDVISASRSRSRSRTRGRPREARIQRVSPVRQGSGAAAVARVSNLHPRVTSGDLQRLFGSSARWVDVGRDASGRPSGRAAVGFGSWAEARAAAERWRHVPLDGYALEIEVERRAAQPTSRGAPRQRRERWEAGERRAQARLRHRTRRPERRADSSGSRGAAAPTAESLDADLSSYMMQK